MIETVLPCTGYDSEEYVKTLSHIGMPLWLPRSQSWALSRPIPGTSLRDLAGAYPMCGAESIDELQSDLNYFSDEFVSFVGVTNPFKWVTGAFFSEHVSAQPYKEHFVADLTRSVDEILTSTARRNARHAREKVLVRFGGNNTDRMEFVRLYRNLRAKKGHLGFSDFSEEALLTQLSLPNALLFLATIEGQVAGGCVVYVAKEGAYFHLSCYSESGYEARAGYALIPEVYCQLQKFGVRWAHLGGAPDGSNGQGVAEFKRRLSTETRTSHLIKAVLQPSTYIELGNGSSTTFFPSYRGQE